LCFRGQFIKSHADLGALQSVVEIVAVASRHDGRVRWVEIRNVWILLFARDIFDLVVDIAFVLHGAGAQPSNNGPPSMAIDIVVHTLYGFAHSLLVVYIIGIELVPAILAWNKQSGGAVRPKADHGEITAAIVFSLHGHGDHHFYHLGLVRIEFGETTTRLSNGVGQQLSIAVDKTIYDKCTQSIEIMRQMNTNANTHNELPRHVPELSAADSRFDAHPT